MGDHFVLLVDRLLTESTLEAAIASRNRAIQSAVLTVESPDLGESCKKVDFRGISLPGKLVECKICHDDDEDSNMETPCSCSGSLKYAHRRCVQRWCNEKGDTMCEICHQQFKPGYTVPAPLFKFGRIPMHFRGNWEIARRDMNNPRIIAMVSAQPHFLDQDFDNNEDDEDSGANSTSLVCCRSMAIIFMFLLILRHTLPLLMSGHTTDYSFSLLMLVFLRTIGVVLPIYVMVKAVTAIHLRRRRNQQVLPFSALDASQNVQAEHSSVPSQPHVARVS